VKRIRCASVQFKEGGVNRTIFGRGRAMADGIERAIVKLADAGFTHFHTRIVRYSGDYRTHLVTGMKEV
jgi:hypothetical protein